MSTRVVDPVEHSMLSGGVPGTFLRYGIPWTLGLLAISSAGVVDGLFIGRYAGAMPLAALNLIIPLISLYVGIGIMFASGGAVRTSTYIGAGNNAAASAMFTKTVVGVLACTILLSTLGLTIDTTLVGLMGADAQLATNSLAYMRMILWFGPSIALGMTLSVFVRADGCPRMASCGLLISAFVNIGLDYVFIAHFGWGLAGAGLATGLAEICSVVFLTSHFFAPHATLALTRAVGSWKELPQACWNGSSEFINEASLGTVILFTNLMLMRYMGADGVAAFTIVSYVLWFGLTISYGISDTLTPLVSICYGARRPERARAILGVAFCYVLVPGLTLFTLLSLVPDTLITFFLPDAPHLVPLTEQFMAYAKWSFICCGTNMVLTSYFTALHRAGQSALVAILRTLLLPLSLLMILPMMWGVTGIFLAAPLAEGLTLLVAVALLLYGRRASSW